MTNRYLTGNPLGSTAPKDLYDNASNFDDASNSLAPSFTDRFGRRRETWSGMETRFESFLQSAGYVFLADYAAGVTITARNQYVIHGGLEYALANSVALPYTATGVWATDQVNFKLISDNVIRQDLQNIAGTVGQGAGLVGYVNPLGAAIRRALDTRLSDIVYAADYGMIANPATDNSGALLLAQAALPTTGGVIKIPRGSSGVGSVSFTKAIRLEGDGPKACTLVSLSATGDVITFTGSGSGAADLGFDSAANRTSGAYLKFSGAWYSAADNLSFTKQFIGIDVDSCIGVDITTLHTVDGTPDSVASGGALVRVGKTAYCGGINIGNITSDVNTAALKPTNGILLHYCDVATISRVLTIHNVNGIQMAPASGQICALVKITDSDIDTGGRGLVVNPAAGGQVLRCMLSNTWIGANSGDGIDISGAAGTVNGFHFFGATLVSNGTIGANIHGALAQNITFDGCQAAGNGGNGLQVTGGANCTWDGGGLGRGDAAGGNVSNGYGVDATSTGAVRNCDCSGNVGGPYSNANPSGFMSANNGPYSWELFPASITTTGGALTTATATVYYKRVDKTVHYRVKFGITANGAGTGAISVSMPYLSSGLNQSSASGIDVGSRYALTGFMDASSANILIYKYDGTYAGGTGITGWVSGTYEIA
jgi:hypothetical protein